MLYDNVPYPVEHSVKLGYLELDSVIVMESLLLPDDVSIKDHVLEKMGIHRQEGETALTAWARFLHELNDLPFDGKVWDYSLKQAVMADRGAFRFMFFLA